MDITTRSHDAIVVLGKFTFEDYEEKTKKTTNYNAI